jgi:hypothetical protein
MATRGVVQQKCSTITLGILHMNEIHTTALLVVHGYNPNPLPLVLLASLFLSTSWLMRRVGAKN